jgi:hypothetical protein
MAKIRKWEKRPVRSYSSARQAENYASIEGWMNKKKP